MQLHRSLFLVALLVAVAIAIQPPSNEFRYVPCTSDSLKTADPAIFAFHEILNFIMSACGG